MARVGLVSRGVVFSIIGAALSKAALYLFETARGHVPIDAGLNSAIVHDPALREEHSTKQGIRPPVILPEHELAHQLTQIGMRLEDIRARGARLLLGHDPQLIQSVRLLRASYA